MTTKQESTHRQRLDTWLWAARFYKTRNLAKEAIDGGKIKLNGHAVKPSSSVKPEDSLHINRAGELWHILVLALNEQRRPASEAETLYQEDPESQTRRLHERERRKLSAVEHEHRRPDSHARELLRRLRGKS